MRFYSTKSFNGTIRFKCIFCEHMVATPDFDPEKGNRHTQAANAINQHVRDQHPSKLTVVTRLKSGSRGAL